MCAVVYIIMIMMIFNVSVIDKVTYFSCESDVRITFVCIFIGYLCGKCRNDAGVSALLNKCVSCGNVNILLIIALGMS